MAKSKEKFRARKLRKSGLSIKEISQKLGVSKSSVSLWCSDIQLTEKQVDNLHKKMICGNLKGRLKGVQVQKDRKNKEINDCLAKARKDISNLKGKELFLAGLSLYWGEGAKTCANVRFYNSDPLAIVFMMRWFRKSLKIDDNRFQMYININEIHAKRLNKVIKYWSKITNIPVKQFRNPMLLRTKNKKIYENFHNHYGTLSIRIAKSRYLLYQILAWIEVLSMAE